MTKEKAEKILPVIQAIINGQKIQVNINNRWEDVDENHNCAFLPESYEYRIKPESKYRPFNDAEECWKEMGKHKPFGWVKDKKDGHHALITAVDDDTCGMSLNGNAAWSLSGIMDLFTFADGVPFGVKEEK